MKTNRELIAVGKQEFKQKKSEKGIYFPDGDFELSYLDAFTESLDERYPVYATIKGGCILQNLLVALPDFLFENMYTETDLGWIPKRRTVTFDGLNIGKQPISWSLARYFYIPNMRHHKRLRTVEQLSLPQHDKELETVQLWLTYRPFPIRTIKREVITHKRME
ncbi:MAG: hypothetical protein WC796_02205 [Candidatus Pacearchaeota archaeon]|jgi:hypothetical protein